MTLLAALLCCVGLPSASAASGTVVGSGQVHQIDLTANTLMVGRHSFKLDFRTRLYDRSGKVLALEELKERFEGDDGRFEAQAAGRQLLLRSLHLIEDRYPR